MKLSRRGFIAAAAAFPLCPAPFPSTHAVQVFVEPASPRGSAIPSREQIEALAAILRRPMPRADLIVINGIGYGKDDQLPPPFGSEA